MGDQIGNLIAVVTLVCGVLALFVWVANQPAYLFAIPLVAWVAAVVIGVRRIRRRFGREEVKWPGDGP